VAIALGSNLGDRQAHLEHAVSRLQSLLQDPRVSTFHETEPVGTEGQPLFLNGAMVGRYDRQPRELLQSLMLIERERGRERSTRWAARTLDLDLILFGNQILNEPDLIVPHPRFRERVFVLEPLAEIAPDLIDPVTGLTVEEILKRSERSNRSNRSERSERSERSDRSTFSE
jgi:2-amino-4-hydroxy-6-hydroxymethyldihydropteridine diphosphokinase